MKRVLFIINFIVLGSIWNVCDALCVKPVSQVMPQQAESISGILTMAGLPCLSNEDPEYPCLPCLTLGFVNHDTLYYLTSDNESMLNKLDELEELWSQDTMVFITGIPYKKDNINYMNVKEVTFGNEPPQASTWYGIRYVHDYPQEEYTPLITNLTYSLGSDTVIDGKLYRQIRYTHEYEHITNAYRGAIRQSEDGQQVYYIPWGSNNEYLLYNFDVKQGDIVHAYAGFNDISCEEMAEPGRSIIPAWTVMSVQTIDGRKHIFVQDEEYGTTIEWIEGIGTQYILWPFGRTCYSTGLEVQFHHALCAADNEGNILYSFNTDDLGIRNECPNWQPMAIEHIHSDSPSAVKTLHDGHILILRGDKTYTLTGQEVK